MKRITDPDFRYTPAVATDIRETFARARQESVAAREKRLRKLPGSDCVFPPLESETVWTLGD